MKVINSIFEEKAAQMGHDIEALNAGHEVSSVIDVTDIDKLKELLQHGRRMVEQKDEEARLAFGELPPSNANDKTALQQRVNHFIYGNYELSEADKAAANATLFPMKLLAVSAKNKTINEPTTLGAAQHTLLVNYSNLTLGDTAYFVVEGTGGSFTIANLVRTGSAPATMGDFNILGRRGIDGLNGQTGPTGPDGYQGNNGGNGAYGQYGGNGTDGFPSQSVTINITNSIQSPRPVIVYTCSGIGGNGGTGGAGGKGGNGGSGGPYPSIGGTGGNGGNGGSGGNSPDAADNIMVYVAAPYINQVQAVTAVAPGGIGGAGGAGGAAGSGSGQSGATGNTGAKGQDGTTGAPGLIIIRPY